MRLRRRASSPGERFLAIRESGWFPIGPSESAISSASFQSLSVRRPARADEADRRRALENRRKSRMAGGEGRIRTPETLQDRRGGIRSEFGALFGPNKKHPCWREFVRLGFGSVSALSGSLLFARLMRGIW